MMKYPQLYEMALSKAPISQDEWSEFERGLERLTFKKGEFLARPGEEADKIYVVFSGLVRNYQTNASGREFTKVLRGPFGLVGPYQEILSHTKTKYFIQAITDLEVLAFSYRDFEKKMSTTHAWERLGRIIAQENYLEKEQREFMLMHMNAEERYLEFLKDFKDFKDVIPQYQIANYLGISPEALNRQLKKK